MRPIRIVDAATNIAVYPGNFGGRRAILALRPRHNAAVCLREEYITIVKARIQRLNLGICEFVVGTGRIDNLIDLSVDVVGEFIRLTIWQIDLSENNGIKDPR